MSSQNARCTHNKKFENVRLCPTLSKFMAENPIAQLEFLVEIKDAGDKTGVSENKSVLSVAYLQSDGAMEVLEK